MIQLLKKGVGAPAALSLIRQVKNRKLTYLSFEALLDLHLAIQDVQKNHTPGILVEAGCALGGSTIVMAKANTGNRAFKVYDAFGMIPEPGEKDGEDAHQRFEIIKNGAAQGINGDTYYGYKPELLHVVEETLSSFGIEPKGGPTQLVPGLYEDVLQIDEPVAVAHIDCDWYDSVLVCLEQVEPNLAVGGRLIIDDYEAWSGCKSAIDDYFAGRKGYEFKSEARLHIIKRY